MPQSKDKILLVNKYLCTLNYTTLTDIVRSKDTIFYYMVTPAGNFGI